MKKRKMEGLSENLSLQENQMVILEMKNTVSEIMTTVNLRAVWTGLLN